MDDRVESLIQEVVRACLDAFGEARIESMLVHGSTVKGGAIPGYSDLDFQVYLTPDCFDSQHCISEDAAFAIQARLGPLPWQDAGIGYPQVYFHDWRKMPSGWVGPAPGSYRDLIGTLPDAMHPTPAQYVEASRLLLAALPQRIAYHVTQLIDTPDATLLRRIRLLGTDVAPTIFALQTAESADPLELWATSKLEALALLESRYPAAPGPGHARSFYDAVRMLFGGGFDPAIARQAWRDGISFLRWASVSGT